MDMERTANIAFMVLMLVPVILVLGLMNLYLFRQRNLSRRRDEKPSARALSVRTVKGSNVRPLHTAKRRPSKRKKALLR